MKFIKLAYILGIFFIAVSLFIGGYAVAQVLEVDQSDAEVKQPIPFERKISVLPDRRLQEMKDICGNDLNCYLDDAMQKHQEASYVHLIDGETGEVKSYIMIVEAKQ